MSNLFLLIPFYNRYQIQQFGITPCRSRFNPIDINSLGKFEIFCQCDYGFIKIGSGFTQPVFCFESVHACHVDGLSWRSNKIARHQDFPPQFWLAHPHIWRVNFNSEKHSSRLLISCLSLYEDILVFSVEYSIALLFAIAASNPFKSKISETDVWEIHLVVELFWIQSLQSADIWRPRYVISKKEMSWFISPLPLSLVGTCYSQRKSIEEEKLLLLLSLRAQLRPYTSRLNEFGWLLIKQARNTVPKLFRNPNSHV